MKKIKHTIVAAAMFLGTAQIGMAGGHDQRGLAVGHDAHSCDCPCHNQETDSTMCLTMAIELLTQVRDLDAVDSGYKEPAPVPSSDELITEKDADAGYPFSADETDEVGMPAVRDKSAVEPDEAFEATRDRARPDSAAEGV